MGMPSKLKAVPALAEDGTPRDLLRAALADAIAALAAKREARATVKVAHDRAADMVTAAFCELDQVEAEIKKAGASQRDEVMASVMRGDTFPGNSRRADAERRKSELEAQIAAAREARGALQEQLSEHDSSVAIAERTVRECRDAVVFEALPAILEATAPVRREFERQAHVVRFLRTMQPFYMSADDPRRLIGHDADRILAPALSQAGSQPAEDVAAWAAAAEKLLTDPDTPLPKA